MANKKQGKKINTKDNRELLIALAAIAAIFFL